MRGFFERLQWKMAAWMQGRNGVDGLSNFLMGVGIILLIASVIPGLDLLSWLVLAVLAVALFRSFSKNIAARSKENAAFEQAVQKPKRWIALQRKA